MSCVNSNMIEAVAWLSFEAQDDTMNTFTQAHVVLWWLQDIITEQGLHELQIWLDLDGDGQGIDTAGPVDVGPLYPGQQPPLLLQHLTALKVCLQRGHLWQACMRCQSIYSVIQGSICVCC